MQAAADEEMLVRRAQTGDLGAFNALVVRHQELAYNVALRMLGASEPAADVTQDAFLKAYQAIESFRGGSFRAWILRIVSNGCYDYLRAQRRRPTTSLDALTDDPNAPASFPDPGELPEQAAVRHELAREIQAGLLTLPPEQRVVVVLSDVQGLSYEEIAEATRTSLGTVKSRLSRARASLRLYLRARGELPGARRRLEERGTET